MDLLGTAPVVGFVGTVVTAIGFGNGIFTAGVTLARRVSGTFSASARDFSARTSSCSRSMQLSIHFFTVVTPCLRIAVARVPPALQVNSQSRSSSMVAFTSPNFILPLQLSFSLTPSQASHFTLTCDRHMSSVGERGLRALASTVRRPSWDVCSGRRAPQSRI